MPGAPTACGCGQHTKQRQGPPTRPTVPPGDGDGRPHGTDGHAPHFIPLAGRLGGRAGRAGRGTLPTPPPLQKAALGWGSQVPWRGSSSWRGHAPCTRGQGQHHHPACLHGTTGHAEFSTGVSFSFTSRGGRVHAFLWETLTEDEEILELIQSWKQTPGDSVWGVILLWPWCS